MVFSSKYHRFLAVGFSTESESQFLVLMLVFNTNKIPVTDFSSNGINVGLSVSDCLIRPSCLFAPVSLELCQYIT